MKILCIHNYYGSTAPSGENTLFSAEVELLSEKGNDVAVLTRHSDDIRNKKIIGTIQGALSTPWNPWMFRTVQQKIRTFSPDVVHVHNTFPLISPAIFHAIGHHAAKVLTLHNYRLFCPAAIPMRDGVICTDCLKGHTVLPALAHGCYRSSRLATAPLAASVALHRAIGTWNRRVDAFIALTDFQRSLMIKAGLPAAKVHVKPNFFPGNPVPIPWRNREEYVVFVGRLSQEKGVETLVQAWELWGENAPELRIVGDGPLRSSLERRSGQLPIRFLGQLPAEAAHAQIARAKLLVLPSECFEGFPMVIREAFAFGTPSAVSDIGPLPSIVKHGLNGFVFASSDSQILFREVQASWQEPGLLEALSVGARQSFESLYNEEANYLTLMGIYEQAVLGNRTRKVSK